MPRLLDLYCGAGGAAMGYARAGFEVVGVDIAPQQNYPFEFVQADALDVLAYMLDSRRYDPRYRVDDLDAIHASPPCQAYSAGTGKERAAGKEYPDLLGPTRDLLQQTGLPWVIENVPGAPMRADFMLCGSMFGLRRGRYYLKRHRLFETSWHGFSMALACHHEGDAVSVVGHGPNGRSPIYLRLRELARAEGKVPNQWWVALCHEVMGIDWMGRDELSESIPPAYTEFIGVELMKHLTSVTSAV